MSDTNWHTHLQNLVEYSRNQNVNVMFVRGCDDAYDVDNQTIEINKRRTPKSQAYILLHELGHHKVIKSPKLAKKFACLNAEHVPRNLSKKMLTLEEEVVAWHIGEDIAERLDIPIDKTYQVLKSKCLKTYVDSIASKKRTNQ
jgi:hypothetical protein